jgi:pSer/pThr/pTyr-binding forkhead associated (FHA) protein
MWRIRLTHLEGSRSGQVDLFPATRLSSLSLGRDPACDVRFHPTDDVVVSRNHAIIEWSREDDPPLFRLSDLLSRNGTFVNGRRIASPVLLGDGDSIRLGADGPCLRFGIERADAHDAAAGRPAPGTAQVPAVTVGGRRAPR